MNSSIGAPIYATLIVPPISKLRKIQPRAGVAIFYYDENAPSKKEQWKLLFDGEVMSRTFSKTPSSRSVVLGCAGVANYLQSVQLYYYSGWDLDSVAASTSSFVGITGPVAISGTATTTVNLYGAYTSLSDTSTNTTVNELQSLVDADVVKWLGTAAATPTVAGVPEVDMTHISGATTVDTVALQDMFKIFLSVLDGNAAGSEAGGTATIAFKDRAGTSTVTTHADSSTGRIRS